MNFSNSAQYFSRTTSLYSSLTFFSVRFKKNAWKPYFIKATFDNGSQLIKSFRSSEYGISFQYFKRPSCYTCKFKIYNNDYGLQADLTVGDNHGVRKVSPSYNHWGSSVMIVHTNKGQYLLNLIKDNFILNKETDSIILENNALFRSIPRKKERDVFVSVLLNKGLKQTKRIWIIMYKDFIVELRKQIAKIHLAFLDLKNN